ncbi:MULTISPECIES: methyltransferase domain-containing protein [unclassified Mesorhizobium]|uniref:class I SAM-dependent methyltransferase n=1 Tax=unclassified Mesorhizobium TaxID=325217 RepID=UPI00333D7F09
MNATPSSQRMEWTEGAIDQFLCTEELGYQAIDLPFGRRTPGASRLDLCDIAFGQDLAGKSVLDVGCYLGYFSLIACERGAGHVRGLDIDPERIRQAKIIADIKGYAPEYLQADIERISDADPFDIVLCLNVLHHLADPIGSLRKLVQITRHSLIVEVAGFGGHDARKLNITPAVGWALKGRPVIYVSEGHAVTNEITAKQKYFFSPEAVTQILTNHFGVFCEVQTYRSAFKDRTIIKATRRRIRHLLIVAGPTSSGKSTFLDHLSAGGLPDNVTALLPKGVERWPQVTANRLVRRDELALEEPVLDGLVLHYDILRPKTTGLGAYRGDQALDLITCAESLTVITLRPSKDRLIKQLVQAEILEREKPAKNSRRSLTHAMGRRVLERGPALVGAALSILPGFRGRHEAGKAASRLMQARRLSRDYGAPRWLDRWYDRWSGYVNAVAPSANIINYDPWNRALLD